MISLTIWFCLSLNVFVLAPPLLINNPSQSLENFTLLTTHANSEILTKRRKIKINRNTTEMHFDINSYRSSWKFVDKNTIRVRFRLYDSLLQSIVSTRFLLRHFHSGHIRIFDEPHEIINSTLTLYLHNIKHGRHIVCLLLYRSKLMISPKYIFCQDIVFNFQKYGHHDIDSDEYGNTFFFLLTQYSIVLGILCILQLVHAARKRRFLRTVYDKANNLRHLMTEHYHHLPENKSTTDSDPQRHALEYLIYNLNRNALYNIDPMSMRTTNEDDIPSSPTSDHQRIIEYEKHLKIPDRLNKKSIIPLFERHQSLIPTDLDEENFDEIDFDTKSYEERSLSYKSLSHILEENKPWMTRLTDNGSIKHSILSSEPLLENTRVHHL